MGKPGPKTNGGKEVVRLNALRHGVLSTTPVVPGIERKKDWEIHRAGILGSFAPEGYLEEELTERIAQLLWRLRRVARYETESIVLEREQIEERRALRESFTKTIVTKLEVERLDRMSRERLLPDDKILEKVMRYEAHLNRQFNQTLHELEALQVRRQGGVASLARLDVQGLPDA